MSVAPAELLAVARELSRGKTEAHRRAAVSRAYYATFHSARRWHKSLPAMGDPGEAKGEHEWLIQCLVHPSKQCSAEQTRLSRWLASQLSTLRPLRVDADYELTQEVPLEIAVHACGLAGGVLGKIPPRAVHRG